MPNKVVQAEVSRVVGRGGWGWVVLGGGQYVQILKHVVCRKLLREGPRFSHAKLARVAEDGRNWRSVKPHVARWLPLKVHRGDGDDVF